MNIEQALTQIAQDGGLEASELIQYAAEDHVGGRDTGAWANMSTFADEGKVLYALIRALRPQQVIEIGVDSGGTSTHILSALDANGAGQLYSVDIKAEVGLNVPDSLRSRWTLVQGDGLYAPLPDHADFCFEDGDHSYEFTHAMLTRLKTLNPRAILSHDYATGKVYGGFFVKEAFDAVFPDGQGIEIEGAFTGLGLWFNREWREPIAKRKAAKR